MTNINKIIITHINLAYGGVLPPLELFDFHIFYGLDNFIGVSLDSNSLRCEIEESPKHDIYSVETFQYSTIPLGIKSRVLEYIGFSLSVDNILDIMLDTELDEDRKFYLETILYYKSSQEGKKIQKHKLKVKNFDDLVNHFPEDFVSYKILNNNNDFSESEIVLETYLTKEELNNKFKEYLHQ